MPLIETYSSPEATVLDPFAGSGSTLLGAKMLGRNWLAVELDGKYHAAAVKWLVEAGNQPGPPAAMRAPGMAARPRA
ncbi:MAG TPA: DNA methyltransferase [Bryobacteraceae bacterium]|nr:DNA methyltransferase [Bryobacteraceae bacterium]